MLLVLPCIVMASGRGDDLQAVGFLLAAAFTPPMPDLSTRASREAFETRLRTALVAPRG